MTLISENKIKIIKEIGLILLWVCLLGGLVFALGFMNKQEENIECRQLVINVEPENINFFDEEKVLSFLKYDAREDSIIGVRISDLNTADIEEKLRQNSWVEKAKVYSNLNGRLSIKIQQREPLMRIYNSTGTAFYVDKYGIKMPLSIDFSAGVLVANGNIFERYTESDSLYSFVGQQLLTIALYVDNDDFWKAQIEQIFVTSQSEFILIPKVGNHKIIFGHADNLEEKFRKLLIFYKEGLNRIGWNKYKTINLKYKNQIICEK